MDSLQLRADGFLLFFGPLLWGLRRLVYSLYVMQRFAFANICVFTYRKKKKSSNPLFCIFYKFLSSLHSFLGMWTSKEFQPTPSTQAGLFGEERFPCFMFSWWTLKSVWNLFNYFNIFLYFSSQNKPWLYIIKNSRENLIRWWIRTLFVKFHCFLSLSLD